MAALLLCLRIACGPVLSADSATVLVFPLEGPEDSENLSWMSEGIALSISTQIESREVKVIGRSERISLVEKADLPPGARLSRASMIRVAQQVPADFVVMGNFSGSEQDLHVSVRVLDVKGLKLSSEMPATGPISALPQMENQLSWLVLNDIGFAKNYTRLKFQERTRKIPNAAYMPYVQSLGVTNENEQLQLLMKSLEKFRDFPDAQFKAARIFFHKGDCQNAMSHLLLARRDESNQLETDFIRGTCFLEQDLTAEAMQTFSQIISSSPSSLGVLNNVGVAFLRTGDYVRASNLLMEARNLSRNDPTVALNLAILRHMQGNDPAARTILEDALKSHPRTGMLNFLLAFVLKRLGEPDKAAAALSRAKNLGINVEKLQTEDPKQWSQVLSTLESSGL